MYGRSNGRIYERTFAKVKDGHCSLGEEYFKTFERSSHSPLSDFEEQSGSQVRGSIGVELWHFQNITFTFAGSFWRTTMLT